MWIYYVTNFHQIHLYHVIKVRESRNTDVPGESLAQFYFVTSSASKDSDDVKSSVFSKKMTVQIAFPTYTVGV